MTDSPRLERPNEIVVEWMLAHPTIARGHLITAARAITAAADELQRLVGYFDGKTPESQYIELGMTSVESKLLTSVRALAMMPERRFAGGPSGELLRPGEPALPLSPWRTE